MHNIKKKNTRRNGSNGYPLSRAEELVEAGIDNAGKGTTFYKRADSLELISHLLDSLHVEGVDYCHWKSNIKLNKSFEGKEDLDIFVSTDTRSRLMEVLNRHGFKPAQIKYGLDTPGVKHYYGLDEASGELVHVHLFTELLTGESFVKSHYLPFNKMLLQNHERIDQLEVVTKPAELVLFILRTFIKYSSFPDMIRLLKESSGLRKELRWLLNKANLAPALALLQSHCPEIDELLFLRCVDAINKNRSFFRRAVLARQVRSRLKNYTRHSYTKRLAAYAQVVFARIIRGLKGNIKDKTLCSGGAIIAIIGGDATGKSTLVAETGRWLGRRFVLRTIHTGKPSSSLLTIPVNAVLYLVRKITSLQKGHRSSNTRLSDDLTPTQHQYKGLSSVIYALRATTLAWDRLGVVQKAKRRAEKGEIIVCDRFPSRVTGAMDSPRLEREVHKTGRIVTIYNRLARIEKRLYARIPPADIVLKLKVTLETALQRNRDRDGQDDEDYLASRHRQVSEWDLPGARGVFEIDTDQPLEDTIRAVKSRIWESI